MTIYNEAQKEAIHHVDGPMQVIAGPGSGKTMVITQRTKHLIENAGVDPHRILVITFTKAAAVEMKKRFYSLAGHRTLPVTFCTFHSLFFQILKHAYHYTTDNIMKDSQKLAIIRSITSNMDLSMDDIDFANSILSEISYVKGEQIALEAYHSTSCAEDTFRVIYREYCRRQQQEHLIDFDDMMVYVYELFKERKDILAVWQQRFPYILIDEYQDINRLQYQIVQMLAQPEQNLFVVGDDDQSIYYFRGARPEIMLRFKQDYPMAKQVVLDVNYRCARDIIYAADCLIQHNRVRFPKSMTYHRDNESGKATVRILRFEKQKDENLWILQQIQGLLQTGAKYSDIAIIARTNIQPRSLVGTFIEYDIPFQMRDRLPNIFEHWIASNILDYLHIAMGDKRRSRFLRIANRPNRYLKREYFDDYEVSWDSLWKVAEETPYLREIILKFESDIQRLATLPPYAAIHYIRKAIEYEEYLREYADYRNMKTDELFEVLDELMESARPFKTHQEWFTYIEEYQQELERQRENLFKKENREAITVTTMHSAKGLEYDHVFLIDACETITPHKKAIKDAELEEERRMFYVAMTRARKTLCICYPDEIYSKEYPRSRFLDEIEMKK
ncbi:MAG: ATP-dependent helicase [Lachnospiraceae bacterium]